MNYALSSTRPKSRSHKPQAVILAGGLGTRLRSIVPDVPKPLAPIAGRPFLEYLLDYWIEQGLTEFILAVGYRHELIWKHFGSRYREARLTYVIESHPLGTGGGIVHAVQTCQIKEPFLLLNGDTYFTVDWQVLRDTTEHHRADGCIAMIRASQADRYQRLAVDSEGAITRLTKEKAGVGDYANGGVYWLHADLFNSFALEAGVTYSLEQDMLRALIQEGKRFYGIEGPRTFIDIGLPADYQRAASILAAQSGD